MALPGLFVWHRPSFHKINPQEEQTMDRKILKLLSKNARATAKEIAVMLGRTEGRLF